MSDLRLNHAPYNFVSLSSTVLKRYQNASELPPHDVLDENLLTGQIRITVKAETPIFIGAGKSPEEGKTEGFYKAPCGKYAIPGSSFRGLLRTNMQILGMGLLRPEEDFNDYRLMYRNVGDSSASLGNELKNYYKEILGQTTVSIQFQTPDGTLKKERYQELRNVKCGFLYKRAGVYYIRPSETGPIPITRSLTPKYANRWAFWEDVWYRPSGKTAVLCEEGEAGAKAGIILGTGYMNDQNHLYIFSKASAKNTADIALSKETVAAYQEDYQAKKNSLPGTGSIRCDPLFWALPEQEGIEKPVFYVSAEGNVCFGVSRFLRIPYKHSLRDGLPQGHLNALSIPREKSDADCPPFLDYPYSILGYVQSKHAFHSRVAVEDLLLNGPAEFEKPVTAILAEPKPSFYQGYNREGRHFNDDNFQLRGFKQYWLKDVVKTESDKEKIASGFAPMSAGHTFSGTIHYRNLHPDELGLLLWCLILDPGCFQNIGKGKPYGYGRISVKVNSIKELSPTDLYGNGKLDAAWKSCANISDRIQSLIAAYEQAFASYTGSKQSIRKRKTIEDFMAMKKTIQSDERLFGYMNLDQGDYQNLTVPLPSVQELCNSQK